MRFVETFCLTDPAPPAVESSQGLLACKGLLTVTLELRN